MPIKDINQNKKACAYQHIFLLSHMRANTSLISHILGSHPQISGYYEMHLSYVTEDDLFTQEQLYASKDTVKSSSKYLFDKILHNKYEFLPELLVSKKIKILLSIRPPEQTIKSIISLFQNKKTGHPYAEPENATEYYIDRITKLAQFCERNKGSYYYYDADLIRTSPKKTLDCMQKWLSLTTPLTGQYQIFSQTGRPGAGDSTGNMKKGRIVQRQSNYEDIKIPRHLLQNAVSQAHRCKDLIVAHAIDSITA